MYVPFSGLRTNSFVTSLFPTNTQSFPKIRWNFLKKRGRFLEKRWTFSEKRWRFFELSPTFFVFCALLLLVLHVVFFLFMRSFLLMYVLSMLPLLLLIALLWDGIL